MIPFRRITKERTITQNVTLAVWIALMFILMLMAFELRMARAHENQVWIDAERFYAEGQKQCGMSYILAYTGNQTWQPYLMAINKEGYRHWHKTPWEQDTPSCKKMFQQLMACAEPTTDAEITFCTGEVDTADPSNGYEDQHELFLED